MAENLRTTRYRNGNVIQNVINENQWGNLTTGAWCHYNNDSQYDNPHGKLYNWYAVEDPRNLCPTGWHVPSDEEWDILVTYLDPNGAGGNYPNTAGGKMKSVGTNYWPSPNVEATNESGFSAIPSGQRRLLDGTYNFNYTEGLSQWWSSTEEEEDLIYPAAYSRLVISATGNAYGGAYMGGGRKKNGCAIRCIKD
jgi:uncharacterized protein (TIGR02145 family)